MKPLSFAVLVFLAACSAQKASDSTISEIDTSSYETDSVSGDEYAGDQYAEEFSEEDEGEYEEGEMADDELVSRIDDAIQKTASESTAKSVYSLYASFEGYENGSDVTYYFDDDLSLTHCEGSWSMEGTSGKFTYYFDREELVCGNEENYYNDYEEYVSLHSALAPAFGYSKTNGTEDDSGITMLGEADFETRKSDSRNQYETLLKHLKEYRDSVKVEDNVVKLEIENVVNYGQDFTEKQHYRISRQIFDGLIRD